MVERRFLVEAGSLDRGAEQPAAVVGAEHHHLSRVLRLRAGDAVSLFDGAGRGSLGVIESIGNDRTIVRITGPDDRAAEPSFQLTLAQGIAHHDKMDLVIQKTTEIGVARIVPVVAERSVVRPGSPGTWARLERWRRVAAEAARQSGRLRVPSVDEPRTWGAFTEALAREESGPRLLLSVEEGAGRGGLARELLEGSRAACLAVGPEGGWTPSEVERGGKAGFEALTLGPRILRAETAGIVAAALVMFLAGEMGVAERPRSAR